MALTGLTKIQKVGISTTTIPTLGGSENTGVVTATNFIGDGSGLSNVTGSGAGVIVRDGGSLVGTAGTINFGTNLNVSAISAGIVTVTNAVSASALTNLSDVTVSSASNGQILKHNGSVFVNVAETDTTYSQSSVASGSNVNLRLTDSGGTNDDILITAGSNITFSSVSAGGFTIAASGGGGGGLSNVVEDTTPELGGNLNLNNKYITGSGGANISGVVTATSFVGNITGNVTGNVTGNISGGTVAGTTGTFTGNVTLGDSSSDTISMNGDVNTNILPSTNGNKDLGNSGNRWGEVHGVTFHGSGVNLSGVVTSIVAGSNISLAGGPTGIVTISSSGGGGLSLSNGTNNNVVTASSATALNGEGNLTFDGTTLVVTGNQTVSGSVVVGTAVTINSDGINVTGVSTFSNGKISFNANGDISGRYINLAQGDGTKYIDANLAAGNQLSLRGYIGNSYHHLADFVRSGLVRLNFSGNERLVTDSAGVKIAGVCTATSFSGLNGTGIVVSGVSTFHNNIVATATTALSVTAADESTDTSCNLLFATAASGNVAPKTGSNLTFNSNTGALTAGSFVKSGGSSSQFLKADGSVDSNTYLTGSAGISNVVEDTSPELGGNLVLNGNDITGTGDVNIVGLITATSAVTTWTVGNSGADHYTFTGNGFTSATNDPDLYLVRGQRYSFIITSGSSHPFYIKTTPGTGTGNQYTTGVTNNGATSGSIHFNVPFDAPAHLYYQCSAHTDMVGNIYIVGQHLANGANNRILTATGAYGINAESNFTFDGNDMHIVHDGLAVNIFESNDNHSRLRIRSGDSSLAQLEFADQTDADAGEIRYDHANEKMTFHVGNNSERLGITSTGDMKLGSGTPDGKLHLDGIGSGDIVAEFTSGSPMFTYRNGSGAWFHAGKHPSDDAFVITHGGNTTATEVFRIASNGHITAPHNVAFSANGGPSDITTNVIIFGTSLFQRGGTNYSTSTGIFTAPVDGIYHFMCNPYRYQDSNDSALVLEVSTNGGTTWATQVEIRNMNNYNPGSGADSGRGWFTLSLSQLIELNANDEVRVKAVGRVHCNGTFSRFSGFLVA